MKITMLGMWCTNSNCKFIDKKHIQIELTVNIWYSYDNDSKTYVIDKEFCFVKEIDFNELNDTVEILEEEKKIPEKLEEFDIQGLEVSGYSMSQAEYLLEDGVKENREMINWILNYLKSKGE